MKRNHLSWRIASFLLILLLTPVFVSAQSATDQLISAKWTYENASIEFKADRSGVFVNNSGKVFDMIWSAQGDQIQFEYQFYGKRSELLTLAQSGEQWTLTDDDGNVYSQSGSAAAEKNNAYTAAFGEELDLGFAKITFQRVQLMKQMHGSGPNSPYTIAADNSRYFALVGTITNTSSRTLNVSQVFAEIKLDQYIYGAEAEVDHNGRLEALEEYLTGTSTTPDLAEVRSKCEWRDE